MGEKDAAWSPETDPFLRYMRASSRLVNAVLEAVKVPDGGSSAPDVRWGEVYLAAAELTSARAGLETSRAALSRVADEAFEDPAVAAVPGGEEPPRNVAIRVARAWHEARERVTGTGDLARPWEEVPLLDRVALANVAEELLARGVIRAGGRKGGGGGGEG